MPKKLAKHAVGKRFFFPWDAFSFERMIKNKTVSSDFARA